MKLSRQVILESSLFKICGFWAEKFRTTKFSSLKCPGKGASKIQCLDYVKQQRAIILIWEKVQSVRKWIFQIPHNPRYPRIKTCTEKSFQKVHSTIKLPYPQMNTFLSKFFFRNHCLAKSLVTKFLLNQIPVS